MLTLLLNLALIVAFAFVARALLDALRPGAGAAPR